MEKLTTKQKLEVVREAKKAYKKILEEGTYSVICARLGYALENRGIVSREWNSLTVQILLPELMKYKPLKLADESYDLWWPRKDTKTRLEVFGKLEAEYIAQVEASLPWYTKLFNKIKKIF